MNSHRHDSGTKPPWLPLNVMHSVKPLTFQLHEDLMDLAARTWRGSWRVDWCCWLEVGTREEGPSSPSHKAPRERRRGARTTWGCWSTSPPCQGKIYRSAVTTSTSTSTSSSALCLVYSRVDFTFRDEKWRKSNIIPNLTCDISRGGEGGGN